MSRVYFSEWRGPNRTSMASRRGETVRQIEPLARSAAFRAKTADPEKRTVDLVWSDGGPPVLRGFWEQFYEELSMDPKHVRMGRLQSGRANLLDSHDSYGGVNSSVLGVIESARLEGQRGIATVRFPKAEDDPEADQVFRKVLDGIITNVSVGYRVHKFEKQKRKRSAEDDEEDDSSIPTMRAVDWEPMEISLVSVPADAGAHVRAAPHSEALRGSNPCAVVTREEPTKMAAKKKKTTSKRSSEETEQTPPVAEDVAADDDTTDEIEVEDSGSDDAGAEDHADDQVDEKEEPKRAAAPSKMTDDEQATVRRAERERIQKIEDFGRRSKTPADEIRKMIDGGLSVRAAGERILESMKRTEDETPTRSGVRVEVTSDRDDKFARGAMAWIWARGGMTPVIKRAIEEKKLDAKDYDLEPGEFRGLTLMDLARMSLERRGIRTQGMGKVQLVSKAFTIGQRSGEQSTSDFPVLLESAMYKALQAAYKIQADTWRRFCAIGEVGDFRPHNRYRTAAMGILPTVPEGDEYENMAIPDGEKSTVSVLTKGGIIAITRQTIINDDMGALTSLSKGAGRQAALTIEAGVYAALAANPTMVDGNAFFSTAHKNIGSGGPLSGTTGVTALDSNRVQMKNQLDPGQQELLDIAPAILLVPAGLGGTARVLNDARYDPAQSNKFEVPNIVNGMFRDIIDTARLSGTTRYIFADPGNIPAIEVDFLDGIQDPYLETKEGWRVDGVQWKVRLDFGVNFIDWRGALQDPGT